MGFRFRRSIKLMPGVRLNVGKRGTSFSFGGRGATVNVGRRGVRTTLSIPGTGLSYTTTSGGRRRAARHASGLASAGAPTQQPSDLGAFIGLCVAAASFAVFVTWTLYISVPILAFFGWAVWYQSQQRARLEAAILASQEPLDDSTSWPSDDGTAIGGTIPADPSLRAAATWDPTASPLGTVHAETAFQRAGGSDMLSDAAQDLIEQQPTGWEYLLFARVLMDEVALQAPERRRAFQSRRILTGERLTVPEMLEWIQARPADARRIVADLDNQMNRALQAALGPPGKPADPDALVATAHGVAACYGAAIAWRARVRGASVPRAWSQVQQALAQFCDGVVTEVERFGPELTRSVETAAARLASGDPAGALKITMKIDLPQHALQDFKAALAVLSSRS